MSSNSVWPYDYFSVQAPALREPNALSVFIISPMEPKAWMDSIEQIVKEECKRLETTMRAVVRTPMGVPLELGIRADRIHSPGVIHSEIWESLARCDVLVADISRLNPNVFYELGTVASHLPKERVILIREESPEDENAFDISPIRHCRYTRSLDGIQKLREFLRSSLLRAMTALLLGTPGKEAPPLPLNLDFHATDSPWIFSPSECHRLVTADCLEFGSLNFLQSFLSVANLRRKNVRVEATVRFLRIFHHEPTNRAFISISLRAEHPYANYGNFFYVREDGTTCRTVPNFDPPNLYQDEELTTRLGVVPTVGTSIRLVHEIKDERQKVAVNGTDASFDLSGDRLRGDGYMLLQAWLCIVGLESLIVSEV